MPIWAANWCSSPDAVDLSDRLVDSSCQETPLVKIYLQDVILHHIEEVGRAARCCSRSIRLLLALRGLPGHKKMSIVFASTCRLLPHHHQRPPQRWHPEPPMLWTHFRRTSRRVISMSSPEPLDLHLKVTNRSLNEGVWTNHNLPLVITYSIFGYLRHKNLGT
jgi:hypothetical protein